MCSHHRAPLISRCVSLQKLSLQEIPHWFSSHSPSCHVGYWVSDVMATPFSMTSPPVGITENCCLQGQRTLGCRYLCKGWRLMGEERHLRWDSQRSLVWLECSESEVKRMWRSVHVSLVGLSKECDGCHWMVVSRGWHSWFALYIEHSCCHAEKAVGVGRNQEWQQEDQR